MLCILAVMGVRFGHRKGFNIENCIGIYDVSISFNKEQDTELKQLNICSYLKLRYIVRNTFVVYLVFPREKKTRYDIN